MRSDALVEVSRTSVIVVAFDSAAVLPKMLASVPTGVPGIVVDNASADGSTAIAAAAGAQVIRLDRNCGFGPGCNRVAAQARTEFLLFLNPDVTLGAACLTMLEQAADRFPTVAGFNPAMQDRNGGPSFKRGSQLLPRREWMARARPDTDYVVPMLSGAALFCRRVAFDRIGGYDDAIFLYHEDDDLAVRLRGMCGPLMFIPAARVGHHEGRSSPRSVDIARIKSYHMARSRVYAMNKHGRPFPFGRSLCIAIEKLAPPLVLLSWRKRVQAVAFLRGVVSTLRDPPA